MTEFKLKTGSALQVFNGTAEKTSGGLKKKDLKKNKNGSVVSVKKSKQASKGNSFIKQKEKARKAGAESFKYTNAAGEVKIYYKSELPTGMVIYSSTKPSSSKKSAKKSPKKSAKKSAKKSKSLLGMFGGDCSYEHNNGQKGGGCSYEHKKSRSKSRSKSRGKSSRK